MRRTILSLFTIYAIWNSSYIFHKKLIVECLKTTFVNLLTRNVVLEWGVMTYFVMEICCNCNSFELLNFYAIAYSFMHRLTN